MVKAWSVAWEERLWKERLPYTAKQMMPIVEEECDRMEYAGSRMYDETPDLYMMQRLIGRICEKAADVIAEPGIAKSEELRRRPPQKRAEELYVDDEIFETDYLSGQESGAKERYLQELITVLLYQELFYRRVSAKWKLCASE